MTTLNAEKVAKVIAMWRYKYSPYTISCTLDVELPVVDRTIYAYEDSLKPRTTSKKERK